MWAEEQMPPRGKESKMEVEATEVKINKAQAKRQANLEQYPHAIIETLTLDAAAGNGGKYKVQIRCVECGNEDRWVYTSDLFQVNRCTACSEAAAKTKKAAKRAEAKASRELAKANAAPVVVQA